MTTETKTTAATLHATAFAIDYIGTDGEQRNFSFGLDDDGEINLHNWSCVENPTREAALAIAEAFTRLAEELPEAPTND